MKEVGKIGDKTGANVYLTGKIVFNLLSSSSNSSISFPDFPIELIIEGNGKNYSSQLEKEMSLTLANESESGTYLMSNENKFTLFITTAKFVF